MKKNFGIIGLLVLLGAALYLFSRADYLFFHITIESITLIVGILIFTISIISRKFDQSSFVVTLGPGMLMVSIITFIHMITFKGMNIIDGYDANLPTQLWIVLNYLLSASILIAIISDSKKMRFSWNMFIFASLGIVGTVMCFTGIFPDCFVEGTGLTLFKKASEYVIIIIYLICIVLIYRKKTKLDAKIYIAMLSFLLLLIVGEFMFTLYSDVYGIQNFIGHYFRLLAFLSIYIFVVVESIQKPFNSIFIELKELSKQFESILDHIPGLVFYKDTKNNFIRVNKYMADAHKTVKSAMEGKNLKDIYPLDAAAQYYEDDLLVINSGEETLNIEEIWETEQGPRWVNTGKIPFRNQEDQIIGILGLSFDITERKNAEQRIKVLQQAIEQSPSAIVITDTNGNITFVNRAFEIITGYTFDEAIGQNPRILKHNSEGKTDYKELWDTLLSGKEWRGIFENKKKNGEVYWESASLSPIFDENGKIINYLAIKEDFTERHRLELELERLTRIDFLTKVNNRRYFYELAENELIRNKRYHNNSAFLMLDIDHFKMVNDKFGHNIGDEALKKITEVCSETIRESDFMGRLGGEEFGIYLINTNFEEAMAVAERIRENVFQIDMQGNDDTQVQLSVSIGITRPLSVDEELSEIMKRADEALFKAKELGRNKVASL